MRKLFGKTDDLLWAMAMLLFLMIATFTLLRMAARYAPSPLSSAAQTVADWADPGNV